MGMLQRIFSTLVLIAILFLGSALILTPTVTAAESHQSQSDRLSPQLANAVLKDLSHKAKIPVMKLKITDYTPKIWSDGCLGLPQPNEFCTQALVHGWRITLSGGRHIWVYRTDQVGRVLRLEAER